MTTHLTARTLLLAVLLASGLAGRPDAQAAPPDSAHSGLTPFGEAIQDSEPWEGWLVVSEAAEPGPTVADEGQPSSGLTDEMLRAEVLPAPDPLLPQYPPPVARSGPPTSKFERQQTDELYDRVLDLEPDGQNRDAIERVRVAVEETETGIDVTNDEWITVKDTKHITWGGLIQGDLVTWTRDDDFLGQPNYFEFRRLRLTAAAEGYGVYDFALQLEIAPETDIEAEVVDNRVDLGSFGVELKDAYVGIKDNPFVGYTRIGHFKVPAGLSQLTAARNQTFLERPLAHQFVPGREVGVAAYNHSPGERITWACGAFIDEMDEGAHAIVDDSLDTRVATRFTWTPYYDRLTEGRYLIHTGISWVHTRPRAIDDPLGLLPVFRPVRFSARPEIHRGDNLVDTGQINTVNYDVLDLELAWLQGPLRVESELVYTNLNVLGPGHTELYGVYVLASYFLTGEQRIYDRTAAVFGSVIPRENLWMVRTPRGVAAGWGAWEIAGRWSFLDFTDVGGQQLQDFTLGLNWYWTPQTRLMLNWIHPVAQHSPVSPLVIAEGDILGGRFEVAF